MQHREQGASVSKYRNVDPELVAPLEISSMMTVNGDTLDLIRQNHAIGVAARKPVPDPRVRVSSVAIPGLNGGPSVQALVFTPVQLEENAPALLYLHGGGYLFGSAEMSEVRHVERALTLGSVIVAPNYRRLSPEAKYPAALDDCEATLRWMHNHALSLGIDRNCIATRGESAGGGLAAALALRLRGVKDVSIAFQLLIYPMIDDRSGVISPPNPSTGQFVWTREANRFAWEAYTGLPPGSDKVPELAAPNRIADLSGLPPTFMAMAALDLFIDENLDFTRRLIWAGVPTEAYIAPGAYHGFEALCPDAAVSKLFLERCMDALRGAFHRAKANAKVDA